MTELAYPSGLQPKAGGMRLEALREVLGPDAVHRFRDVEISGLAFDSRQVRPGFVFFAVPGHLDDGAGYVDDALARGAVAIVAERAVQVPAPLFVVRDARRALADAAVAFNGAPSTRLPVIGVTGTNGKTTVTHMVRHILEVDGRRVGMLGTIGYEFAGRCLPANQTTPDPIALQGYLAEMVERRCDACVMEVSSHALVQQRVRGVRFGVAAFLNLTQDHLDYHGSMRGYAAAKARLFEMLEAGSVAVLHADSGYTERMFEALRPGVRVVSFGRRREATFRATRERPELGATRFTLSMPHGAVDLRLPLTGSYNVENALAAAAIAHALGVSELTIAHGLETMPPVPGRMEPVAAASGLRVFVDYAHTPDALDKVCATLRSLTTSRLTVVFGCGGDRDRSKRAAMARAAARHAERLYLTSDNPRNEDPDAILDDIEAGLGALPDGSRLVEYAREADRARAIVAAVRSARAGEVVLIAGKGHENTQAIAGSVVPFDDREWVLRAFEERPGPGPSEPRVDIGSLEG